MIINKLCVVDLKISYSPFSFPITISGWFWSFWTMMLSSTRITAFRPFFQWFFFLKWMFTSFQLIQFTLSKIISNTPTTWSFKFYVTNWCLHFYITLGISFFRIWRFKFHWICLTLFNWRKYYWWSSYFKH